VSFTGIILLLFTKVFFYGEGRTGALYLVWTNFPFESLEKPAGPFLKLTNIFGAEKP
jgi:hypothetical protein